MQPSLGRMLVAMLAWAGCVSGGCSGRRERGQAQVSAVPHASGTLGGSDGVAFPAAGPASARAAALDGGAEVEAAPLGSPDRRLTRFELVYAVADVFDVDASSLWSLPRPSASIGDVPDVLVGRQLDRSAAFRDPYRKLAHELADTIAARLGPACPTTGAAALACVRARLTEPAARLWRTLDTDVLDELQRAARPHAAEGAVAMFRAAVERLLDDERFFVLQLELTKREGGAGGREGVGRSSGQGVSSGETASPSARRRLASRLALVLWSSVPDLPLLRHAESGALDDPGPLRAEIARMRSDPRFARFARELARQWLRLDRPPLFRPSLAERRLVSDPGRLDAAVEAAARIVGRSVSGGAPARALLSEPDGLLTSTAVLGAISTEIRGGGDESWLGRGLVVQSAFLCRTFPLAAIYPLALWQDHPLLDPHVAATTKRPSEPAMLATRTTDGPCWVCHRQLETIGAALWMFDGLGKHAPHAPRARVAVAGQPVDGPGELERWILGTGRFESCVAQKLATYVLGRAVLPLKRPADRRLVDELDTGAPAGGGRGPTLGDWLQRLLESESFRRPGEPVIREVPTPLGSSNDYVTPRPPAAVPPGVCASFSPGRFLVEACGSSACHGPGSSSGAFAVSDAATAAARLRAAEPRPEGYCADEPKLIDAAHPARSLIIRKVTAGGAVCGAPMPIVGGGATSLDALDHACFVRWVEAVAGGR